MDQARVNETGGKQSDAALLRLLLRTSQPIIHHNAHSGAAYNISGLQRRAYLDLNAVCCTAPC